MDADVHHHPRGAEGMGPQHAELVVRIREVPEFPHQPLGVKRPAFRVPRDEATLSLEAAELMGKIGQDAHLQVMPGHALVVCGGHLTP